MSQEALSPHQFDVEVSDHDSLQRGVTAKKLLGSANSHHRVVVSSEYSRDEAALIAHAMASHHGMVTHLMDRL